MSRSIRAMAALMTLVALAFALSLGQTAPAANAAKPPKPTPTATGPTPTPPTIPAGLRAGLRASNYGITPFPSPTWWVDSIGSMASRFPGSIGEQVAVVVEVSGGGGRGNCWAHFPQPATGTWPNVNWDDVDLFESTFDAFDASRRQGLAPGRAGQLRRADADRPACTSSTATTRASSASASTSSGTARTCPASGKPMTDAEAQAWVAQDADERRQPTSSWSSTG